MLRSRLRTKCSGSSVRSPLCIAPPRFARSFGSAPAEKKAKLSVDPAPHLAPPARTMALPPVEVVFDDFDFVFVNKPEGIVVAGLPGQVKTNTYHEMVKDYISQRFKHIPAVLHRIDKPASGIMVYGKNKEAEKYFQRIVQDNHSVVMKVYLSILCGVPKVASGLVKGGIIRTTKGKGGPRHSIVSSGGTKVVTEYQVLNSWEHPTWGQLSAVAMRAVTGRQHQLRATAAALSCPILGDRRYGGKAAPRVMLHASFVGFLARVGKPYHVICPPDWDLLDASLPRCEAYLRAISPLKKPI